GWYDEWDEWDDEEGYGKYHYDIQIMNLNTSEAKEVPINFRGGTDSYDSTLTLNFGDDFKGKYVSVSYGSHTHGTSFLVAHPLTNPIEININAGTYDLVILAVDQYPDFGQIYEDFSHIYIDRNRTLSGDDSQDISFSDFVPLDTYTLKTTIPGAFVDVDLLAGGTTSVYTWFSNDKELRIPSDLTSDDDLYGLSVSKYDGYYDRTFIKYKSYPNDIEVLDTLPSDTLEMPRFDNNTFSWTPYDPDIAGHEIRFYEAILFPPYTTDSPVQWTIILSDGWLGDSSNYEYQLPDLSGLEGWNEDWYPNRDTYLANNLFFAISGTESNLTKYLDLIEGIEAGMEAGMEVSIIICALDLTGE
ncbi:hypothetical protein, partial [Petrotoga sp. 9PW.55.5.1]|uniref:hypothetical protein n=1 Tax=Petrotoga sp. 9PW.55.5.1 TaxID=1308979 RepID=UPI001314DC10